MQAPTGLLKGAQARQEGPAQLSHGFTECGIHPLGVPLLFGVRQCCASKAGGVPFPTRMIIALRYAPAGSSASHSSKRPKAARSPRVARRNGGNMIVLSRRQSTQESASSLTAATRDSASALTRTTLLLAAALTLLPLSASADTAPNSDDEKAFYSIGAGYAQQFESLKPMSDREVEVLSLIHISEPTRLLVQSRMPSYA